MIKQITLSIGLVAMLAGCDHQTPPTTVKTLDVNRYMGRWYELASLPAWFQRHCYCTQADYRWEKGVMQVTNSCRKGEKPGKLKTATAKAWPVSGSANTQFKVQFYWPFKGDYWVLYVDKDYQHAIVGTPDRAYLWFLSRQPTTTVGEFLTLQSIAKSKGYPVEQMHMTEQSCTDSTKEKQHT